ncbi:MAG: transposase [Terriglobales bacterium]
MHLVGKGKRCSRDDCEHRRLRYRSPEVGRLVLKGHEFGRDVVLWAGDQYVREKISTPRIHKRLIGEFQVPISERSVGNLVDDYLALCQCVAGDSGRVRKRLRRQAGIVLCVDGVHFDEGSPVLYVQREAISGELLYSERRLARSKEDLVPMLRHTAELVAEIGVRILGIVSDKEKSLVPAIAEVFPGVPHQFCQVHFLKNVSEPLKADDQELAQAAKETVVALRKVQRTIEHRFPQVAVSGEAVGVRLCTEAVAAAPDSTARDEPQLAEARLAAALVRAGTAAGSASGRAVTDPPGLKRLRRLQEVRAAVDEAARKKGLQRRAGH